MDASGGTEEWNLNEFKEGLGGLRRGTRHEMAPIFKSFDKSVPVSGNQSNLNLDLSNVIRSQILARR